MIAAIIRVSGYSVDEPLFTDDELNEAAREIASDIGMALATLGRSAAHGHVTVEIGGCEGSSDA